MAIMTPHVPVRFFDFWNAPKLIFLAEMMRRYCHTTAEEIDENIRSRGDKFLVYRGFIKFCEQVRN